MACPDDEKVVYATFMLVGEAEHWWRIARQQLVTDGTAIDWPTFRCRFLEKYFPEDLRRRKELEFLNLKQGSTSVGEYAAKFDELSRCGQQGHYSSSCHLARNDAGGNDKGRNWNGNRSNSGQNQTGNRRQPNPTNSTNPSRRPNMRGCVYTMSGIEATHSDDLIQCACVINGVSLRVLYDSGGTHSFISNDCVRQLKLPISLMTGNLIVSTLAGPSIATSLVCRDCRIYLEGQEFLVNLICLPLSDLDVILGMDWLSANHVMLDCPNKKLAFSLNNVERTKEETRESQDGNCTRDPRDAKTIIFAVFAIDDPKDDPVLDEISVVHEYLKVFPKNVPGLPLEREVEFSIDLVPGTGPISMAPYQMSPVELTELKQ
ncbi:uncharacterized protein LOC113871606 [Abrus precatorius]|uniref:Uncharacterized protein LOC113871606 n=1 Tax=Abrus precatorius TaxID=3816 RepID=A0A8B8M909_ABRPR|nr:uncharacterized protein LOC113871606 [Abrus precatorius]